MSCICTEDKEVTSSGVIIGRNKVECNECKVSREAREALKAKEDTIREKKAYLASTDYIVLRQSEQATLTSEEFEVIKVLRQAARDAINALEAE